MKIDILNRFNASVIFTANIECADDAPLPVKIGLAVMAAVKAKANLSWANLSGVNLSGVNLSWANLYGTNLYGANLSGADLRIFKSSMWFILAQNKTEIAALIDALKNGRVDGSCYKGPCACLVGTIANAKNVDYRTLLHNPGAPIERWFAMIREGDKPTDDTGGGFASKLALKWAEEFQKLMERKP